MYYAIVCLKCIIYAFELRWGIYVYYVFKDIIVKIKKRIKFTQTKRYELN